MRSLTDLLGYAPLPDGLNTPYFVPLSPPAMPPSMWRAEALTNPGPFPTPASPQLYLTGQSSDQAAQPVTSPDLASGGILGPIFRNGWPPSRGILAGQIPDELPRGQQGSSSGSDDLSTSPNALLLNQEFNQFPLSAFGASPGISESDVQGDPTNLQTGTTTDEPRLGPPQPSPEPQSTSGAPARPEPSLLPRIWGRVKDNFAEAYETPLGPGPEYRAFADRFIRPTGTWMDSINGPVHTLNAALLLDLPELIDAVGRAGGATYNSAIDAFVEQLVSTGVQRGNAERLGRDLKSMPQAFAGAPGAVWPGTPPAPIRVVRQFPGQNHHAISKAPHNALEDHPKLWGYYEHRDDRFVTTAVDRAAHKGWQEWHRDYDNETAKFIEAHPDLTPQQFEAYLSLRYDQPDLAARFPNGLVKKKRLDR